MRGSAEAAGFEEDIAGTTPFSNLGPKARKLVGFLLPALIFQFGYWSLVLYRDLTYVFIEKYPMSITMIVGSLMAGESHPYKTPVFLCFSVP